ncbi:MAG: glutathione peroxidase [Jaaginema sp. PMC 1079.18]|nr:glutathione peroxidase [Jaaginema sp. PMC 1080.18]MEC4853708.1 glutathione peroxidase [Jaaginema sp. PMC 1079.18]MEC4866779.1 glutathione peroxidase [Jaaginema sp. PMC 1078.18]
MSQTITDLTVNTIDDREKDLKDYLGYVVLIVNVASYCGFTSQYKGLEALNQKYKDQGLRILGFPCNDYGAQEPKSNPEILEFCQTKYDVTFDLFDKVHAVGSQQHPLYKRLTQATENKADVGWNFEKFLVNKTGEVVERFKSGVAPESTELVSAIERELAK